MDGAIGSQEVLQAGPGKKPALFQMIITYIRGAWRYCLGHRVLSCMTCVVNFIFALSQLQGVEWGWPGR